MTRNSRTTPPSSIRLAAIVLSGLGAVLLLAMAVTSGLSDPIDQAVIGVVRAEEARAPLAFLRPLTEAGSTWAVTIVAVALLAGLIWRRRPWMGLAAGLTVLGAAILNTMAKTLVARGRPDLLEPIVIERGFSFPSGHSAMGMVAWGVVAVIVARSGLPLPLRSVLLSGLGVLVALIGISRIYLGVHFPTDVLAGWAAGATVVVLFALLTRGLSSAGLTSPGGEPADGDREAPRSGPPGQA